MVNALAKRYVNKTHTHTPRVRERERPRFIPHETMGMKYADKSVQDKFASNNIRPRFTSSMLKCYVLCIANIFVECSIETMELLLYR